MELQAVETVVRRLFSDNDFRTAAMTDSEMALSEYDLGENERAALVSLCERLSNNGRPVGPELFWF